jgi:hypothetical protein
MKLGTRFSVRGLIGVVAFVAVVLGALRGGSVIGVVVACIVMLACWKTSRTLAERKERAAQTSWEQALGVGFNAILNSIVIIGFADLTFLIVYKIYDVHSSHIVGRSHVSFPVRITILGVIYGLVLALVVTRWLRICLWSETTREVRRAHLAFVAWMFLGVGIVAIFTGFIFEGW